MLRRHYLALFAAAAAGCSTAAVAQESAGALSSRPISIVVPQQAGTLQDTVARALADGLARELGQPVVVENRPSASQVVASSLVARAKPDGHTLMLSAMPNLIAPGVLKAQVFSGNTDFAAVGHLMSTATVLTIAPAVPANDLKEFIALLKANPDKYMYGSAGIGTPMHMFLEMFNRDAGTQSVHVPYKTYHQIMLDVPTNTVQYSMLGIVQSMQLQETGKMKVLGITGLKRDPAFPQVPTLDEQGLKGFDGVIEYTVVAPKSTPSAIVARLNAAVNKVVASEAYANRFKATGGSTVGRGLTPEQTQELIRRQDERFSRLTLERKISLD